MLLTFRFLNIFRPEYPLMTWILPSKNVRVKKRRFLRKIQNLTLTFFCPLISSKGKEFIARCPPFYPGEFEKKLLTQSRARGVFVFDEKINNAYDEHTFAWTLRIGR